MKDERLKLCPFCGGEAEAVRVIDGLWTIECTECGALVDGIATWNSRKLMVRECDSCGPMLAAEREIRELTAKRDELKAFADRVRNAVIKGNDLTIFGADYVPADAYYSALGAADAIAQRAVDLRNEVDQLRKVVQTQAESFAKLERELAMAKEER